MTHRILKSAAIFCLMAFAVAVLNAKPIVVRKSVRENPTVSCNVSGNAELNREVRRFLAACGWFDPVNGDADYSVDIVSFGNQAKVSLGIGGAPLANWNISGNSGNRELAKKIVDLIIERSFKDLKIKGFCQSRIAFCTRTAAGVSNIYACDIDGGNVTQLTRFNSICIEPCWGPKARSICYSKYNRTGIDVIETTVGGPSRSRILSAAKGINSGVAVSPGGNEMALILSFDHQVDLYVVSFGGKRTRLTKGIAVEASPCWSPDGSKLAYVSDDRGAPRIYTCNRNGANKTRLPSIGYDAVTPDWSSDNRIVYAARTLGRYTLGVYDLKTGRNEKITDAPGNFESPAWAPDNRQVVCKRTLNGKSELVIVDTRTGKVRTLLSTPYQLSMPAWSPCDAK